MKISSIVIWLAGGFFVLYGMAFSIAPSLMANVTTGSIPSTVSGLVDFRSTYGGMTVAVGVMIFYLARYASPLHGLRMTYVVLLGMATTRVVGFMVDGATNELMYLYLAAELVGAGLAMFAARSEP